MASSVCHCEESCLAGGDGAEVDSCSCSHDVLQAIRRFVQLCVQEAERVESRPPCQHLLVQIVCSRSHWLQQSLSRDFRVEQLRARTLSKTIKLIKPHCFLFNVRSFHRNPWLIARSHRLRFFYFASFCRVELNCQSQHRPTDPLSLKLSHYKLSKKQNARNLHSSCAYLQQTSKVHNRVYWQDGSNFISYPITPLSSPCTKCSA